MLLVSDCSEAQRVHDIQSWGALGTPEPDSGPGGALDPYFGGRSQVAAAGGGGGGGKVMEEQGALGGLAPTQELSQVPIANLLLLLLQLLQLLPRRSPPGHSTF